MTEYISRDEVLCYIYATHSAGGFKTEEDYLWLQAAVVDAATADVQPVHHGRWIAENRDNRGYADCYTCTNCHCYIYTYSLMKECDYDFCPKCGARMDGDTND